MNLKTYLVLICTALMLSGHGWSQSKKVLFEEFTNASCGPCAQNNPTLKNYIDSKGDTIVAVMYHTNFPGFDPMHNANPEQVEQRRTGYYTDVNAVPWLKGDGNLFPDIWPFTLANFDAAFNSRKSVVPKLTISVNDQRIGSDSIIADVNLNIPQDLPAGNYRLRVFAVEREIEFATPPGTNGERIFEYVFRKGYPDMAGTSIAVSAGNYHYSFRYSIETGWAAQKIYTIAFVQDDAGPKEVLNCASAYAVTTGLSSISTEIPFELILNQNYPNPFNPETVISFSLPQRGYARLALFNILGKEVREMVSSELNAGTYSYRLNASDLSAGVYFYTLETNSGVATKKLAVIK